MSEPALLSVRDLSVSFRTAAGTVRAVDSVSFDVFPGEMLALVGESGSGKSVTAMSVLRLIEAQGGSIDSGGISFEGRDVLALPADGLRGLRGNRISMIFQEPMSSLNPVFTLGNQISEPLILHRRFTAERARREAIGLLELVGMPSPDKRVDEYPHQLSGGMRQRAMIAMALACRPSLLIADEPTTALDVTVQAQILELLGRLQAELGMSVLMITHDLGIVATVAKRALVMYAGRIVEEAPVVELFERPRHPYTAGLFQSLPRLALASGSKARLRPIEGSVPDALSFPPGCRFHPRCRFAFAPCRGEPPALRTPPAEGPQRSSACYYTEQHPEVDYLAPDASERSAGSVPEGEG